MGLHTSSDRLQSDSIFLVLLALLCPWRWGAVGIKLAAEETVFEEVRGLGIKWAQDQSEADCSDTKRLGNGYY